MYTVFVQAQSHICLHRCMSTFFRRLDTTTITYSMNAKTFGLQNVLNSMCSCTNCERAKRVIETWLRIVTKPMNTLYLLETKWTRQPLEYFLLLFRRYSHQYTAGLYLICTQVIWLNSY